MALKKPKKPRAGAPLSQWERYDARMKKYNADKKKLEQLKNKYAS